MNRAACLLAITLAFAMGAYGQNDAEIPAPSFPFVNNAPDYAAWRVTYAPGQVPADENGGGVRPRPDQGPVLLEMRVTKTKPNRRDVFVWSGSQTTEHWLYEGLYLFNQLGDSNVIVLAPNPGSVATTALFPDYSSSDFPELSWLALQNYKGVVNRSDRSCYLFQIPPTQEAAMKQAWIDVKTRLPVAADDGTKIMTYADFREIPSTSPELPPSFADALRDFKKAYSASNGRPWKAGGD